MYEFQRDVYEDQSKKIIINKSRQIGISDIFAYKVCMNAIQGRPNLIFSPSERQSNHFADYAKTYWEALRPFLGSDFLDSESRGYMSFKSGGYFHSLPNSPETVRGLSIPTGGLIIFDEYAHFENPIEIWNAVYPMASRGGSIVVISTPNGEGNHYADLWRSTDMGFRKHLINYKDCPFFTPSIITDLRRTMDELSWRQEYENEFIGTAMSYFPLSLLNPRIDKSIAVWNFPEQIPKGMRLMFGVDIGRLRDKTAIIGVDEQGRVRYSHTIKSMSFADQREFLKKLLPCASIMRIDQNGIGLQLTEELQALASAVVVGVGITNKIKLDGFINLRMRLESSENPIVLPQDYELIRALNLIERRQYGTTVTFEAARTDETGHSDIAFALMLATHPGVRSNLFERDWAQTVVAQPAAKRHHFGFDVSLKEKDEAFAVAHLSEGLDGTWCLIDAYSERLSFPEQIERIKQVAVKYPAANLFVREEAHHAQLKNANLQLFPVRVPADKIERFNNVAPFFRTGKVKVLATCNPGFYAEWSSFPNGVADDMLDATTLALTRLLQAHHPLITGKGVVSVPQKPGTLGYALKNFTKVG